LILATHKHWGNVQATLEPVENPLDAVFVTIDSRFRKSYFDIRWPLATSMICNVGACSAACEVVT
jgi:hypothetical protein